MAPVLSATISGTSADATKTDAKAAAAVNTAE
jgi:hypothetical protein